MDKLAMMQAHLDDGRRKINELTVLNDELRLELLKHYDIRYELEDQLDLTKRNYRIGVVMVIALTLWLGLSNMDYALEVRYMSQQIDDLNQSDLPQRFENVLEALHHQNGRVLELETANEQLLEHCEPRKSTKAIKATPLHELVRGV